MCSASAAHNSLRVPMCVAVVPCMHKAYTWRGSLCTTIRCVRQGGGIQQGLCQYRTHGDMDACSHFLMQPSRTTHVLNACVCQCGSIQHVPSETAVLQWACGHGTLQVRDCIAGQEQAALNILATVIYARIFTAHLRIGLSHSHSSRVFLSHIHTSLRGWLISHFSQPSCSC